GGKSLLESYDYERRPAAAHATQESLKNYHRLVDAAGYPEINQDSAVGQRVRKELGQKLVSDNEPAWRAGGLHGGHVYWPSPVVINDDSAPPERDTDNYVPTTRPGARAPHAWLSPDQSILDLFGPHFTLLKFGSLDTSAFEAAAADKNVPWRTCFIDN